MTERRKSGIAAMLEGKTASLGQKLDSNQNPENSIQNQPLVTMPGQLGAFRLQAKEWQNRIEELQAELSKAKADAEQGGRLRELPVADLHEVSGRRRKLTTEQYDEMKRNIQANGKVLEPIKVHTRPEGGWNIISGNNKTSIVRELGWDTVTCLIEDVEGAQADIDAFYANLFQTPLPDYEKYLGFKMLKESEPGITQDEIAKRTGKPKSTISELMSFDDLPEDVHQLLTNHPQLLGHRAAAQLAKLTKKGMEKEVTKAVQSIASLGIEQSEAVKQVEEAHAASQATPQKVAPKPKREPLTIRSGRSTYCSVHRAPKVLRIEFETKEEADAIEEAVREVLQKRADALKDKK